MTSYKPVDDGMDPMDLGSSIPSQESSGAMGIFQPNEVLGCLGDPLMTVFGLFCPTIQYGDNEARALGVVTGTTAPPPYRQVSRAIPTPTASHTLAPCLPSHFPLVTRSCALDGRPVVVSGFVS